MHSSVMDFLHHAVDEYDLADRKVLEVGAWAVNGSPRPLFTGPYWGVDLIEGRGVDQRLDAHELVNGRRMVDFQNIEVVVCCEMLEHDTAPWLTLQQAREVIEPGGILLLTARGYGETGSYKIHEVCYDNEQVQRIGDFWRFSTSGIQQLLEHTGWKPLDVHADPDVHRPGVFAVARAA